MNGPDQQDFDPARQFGTAFPSVACNEKILPRISRIYTDKRELPSLFLSVKIRVIRGKNS